MPRNGRPDAAAASVDLLQPGRPQRAHARAERTDAGEHHGIGRVDLRRVGGEHGVGAERCERLVRRVEVADAVVDDGDQRRARRISVRLPS